MNLRICLLLGSVLVCPPLALAQEANGAKAIRAVLDDQVAAWNQRDLIRFMKGYWDDEQLTFFSGNNKTAGWKATLERY